MGINLYDEQSGHLIYTGGVRALKGQDTKEAFTIRHLLEGKYKITIRLNSEKYADIETIRGIVEVKPGKVPKFLLEL